MRGTGSWLFKQLTNNDSTNQGINCYNTTNRQEYDQLQEQMHRRNIGIMKLVNAGLCNLFPTAELEYLPIKNLPDLYLECLNKSISISILLQQIVHKVIVPLMWAHRLTSKQTNNPQTVSKTPTLFEKIQFAWLFILLNSQHLYPPTKQQKPIQ